MIRRVRVGALRGVDEGHPASGSAPNLPELYANWANHAWEDAIDQASNVYLSRPEPKHAPGV